jgi:hypothetical protein
VTEAAVEDAHLADLTGDGVIDTRDMRAFARENGLELLPEFVELIEKIEARNLRRVRGKNGS